MFKLARLQVALLLFAFVQGAIAQPMAAPTEETSDTMAKLQAMQMEMQQIGSQLQQIQDQAMAAEPELLAQQESFRDLVFSAMQSNGFDARAAIVRITDLQRQLSSGQLDQDQQQALSIELQTQGQAFQQAQGEAMQSAEVLAAQEALEANLIVAMERQDPAAEQLIARMDEAQAQFQELLQKAMAERTTAQP